MARFLKYINSQVNLIKISIRKLSTIKRPHTLTIALLEKILLDHPSLPTVFSLTKT